MDFTHLFFWSRPSKQRFIKEFNHALAISLWIHQNCRTMLSIWKLPEILGLICSLEKQAIEINVLFTTCDQQDRSGRDPANRFDHTCISASNHKFVSVIIDPIEGIVDPAPEGFGSATMVTQGRGTKSFQYERAQAIRLQSAS